jgi:hypothetical protein
VKATIIFCIWIARAKGTEIGALQMHLTQMKVKGQGDQKSSRLFDENYANRGIDHFLICPFSDQFSLAFDSSPVLGIAYCDSGERMNGTERIKIERYNRIRQVGASSGIIRYQVVHEQT